MAIRLADQLLEFKGLSKTHSRQFNELYYGVVLKEWTLLNGAVLSVNQSLILAEAHFEVWLRQGISKDIVHLERAKSLYKDYIDKTGNTSVIPATTWLQYCRVLMYLGDAASASSVITTVVTTFENDTDIPIYLLFAGAIFKALGLSEQANNYFFEATQIGPPKLFSKMEMMLIISRVLEEMDADSDGNEGAYRIVRDGVEWNILVAHVFSFSSTFHIRCMSISSKKGSSRRTSITMIGSQIRRLGWISGISVPSIRCTLSRRTSMRWVFSKIPMRFVSRCCGIASQSLVTSAEDWKTQNWPLW
jgi:hypothetical protein